MDAVKYVFTKRIQVSNGQIVTDIHRRSFIPKQYLSHSTRKIRQSSSTSITSEQGENMEDEWTNEERVDGEDTNGERYDDNDNDNDNDDDDKPILLPKRVIEIPIQGELKYFVCM